ncbi:MAG: TIGR00725 family protein [Thaumarchaeota archaeon]|nr:TIGR00725 family protein [Nitrososphaerota archaeon]
MKKLIHIGIACSSETDVGEVATAAVTSFTEELAKYRDQAVLLTGGTSGLMTLASRIFSEAGGITVGFVPVEHEMMNENSSERNSFNVIEIRTGLTYQQRSVPLVRSSDSFVVLGGRAGTIIEAYMAYLNLIPTVILKGTGLDSDLLLKEHEYLDGRKLNRFSITEDPVEAARLAIRMARTHILRDGPQPG